MGSPTLSNGIIPTEDKLKFWTVFRTVGAEGEDILKTAKLVHVHDKEGFVVTSMDETYHFIHGGFGDAKITKILELCGVRVKEFIIGSINLAITENGLLYSWCSEFRSADTPIDKQMKQLGRFSYFVKDGCTPTQVVGLRKRKVRKVALQGVGKGRVVALTVGGAVYHWGTIGGITILAPRLMDKEQWDFAMGRDFWKVTSVGCSFGANFVLTDQGQIFRFGVCANDPQNLLLGAGLSIKKIATTRRTICALTAGGQVYSWRVNKSDGNPAWSTIPLVNVQFKDVQDIESCWMEDVCLVESKDNVRFACYLGNQIVRIFSYSTIPMNQCTAQICQKSYRTIVVANEGRNVTFSDDLWKSKEDMDVTFSLEGKTISAHKWVLTRRSEYFQKMFSGNWSETEGSLIEIKDTKYDIFQALLFHIYHRRVTFSVDETDNICDLMKLADCYCDEKARRSCEEILVRNISADNAFVLMQKAALANASYLEGEVIKFILDNRLIDKTSVQDLTDMLDLLGKETFRKLVIAAASHR
ncbi:RCC1 and BTB domain-containing protein 1 [Folsomia candida]|uniref:RCC1 and BTB domain-containing protein 1 n=1 Tax=Folsomia candida TaxID=158441 RepID=UPI001604D9EF|nr:RCC1 and BTB domain-containing protein 1 [Folsomia candida]